MLAREDIAFALAVLLLGLLMMITRRNAVSQLIGFMSLENGLILAAAGAKGMPLVVELSVAFSVLIAFIVFGIFVFRIRERFDTVDVQALDRFRGDHAHAATWPLLGRPRHPGAAALLLLALMPELPPEAPAQRRWPRGLTFGAALVLMRHAPGGGRVHAGRRLQRLPDRAQHASSASPPASTRRSYIDHEIETGRLTPAYLRFYHAMYQAMMGAMNLALLANNIGLLWVAVEFATLSTVVMVGIYRTPQALEAAWKYFILGSVGIALAFFGTILVYLAAQDVLGEGLDAMALTRLIADGAQVRPGAAQPRLRLPARRLRHQGRAGARCTPGCRTPTPRARHRSRPCSRGSCSTSRSTPCCASRWSWRPIRRPWRPGPLMVDHGPDLRCCSPRSCSTGARDIKRLFAYSSIEHMGIITFAFGMGGPVANFAGLLHMTMHSLTKSAIFFAVGHVTQVKGTQRLADITGLGTTHPLLAWGLALGVLAIMGFPPMGVFMSEFLVVSSTFARQPLLAVPLVLGLLVATGRAAAAAAGHPVRARPAVPAIPVRGSYVPLFLHLALVLVAGIFLPGTAGALVRARGAAAGVAA